MKMKKYSDDQNPKTLTNKRLKTKEKQIKQESHSHSGFFSFLYNEIWIIQNMAKKIQG